MRTRLAIAAMLGAASPGWAQCLELDVNNSGDLNVFDVVYLFDMWGEDNANGDFNGDGIIDALDFGYFLGHVDIYFDVDCLGQPTVAEKVAVVEEVTDDDDMMEGNRVFDVLVPFEEDDLLLYVFDATIGCGEAPCWNSPFLSDTAVAIGSAEMPGGDVQPAPYWDGDAFNAGTGVGVDAGWWLFVNGDVPPGLAGQYPGNAVRVATFSMPEGTVVEGSLSVYYRSADLSLHTGAVEFVLDAGDCYADFNDDGDVNILDFVAFQNAFVQQDPEADCDETGAWDIIDFVCFQKAFVAGCP